MFLRLFQRLTIRRKIASLVLLMTFGFLVFIALNFHTNQTMTSAREAEKTALARAALLQRVEADILRAATLSEEFLLNRQLETADKVLDISSSAQSMLSEASRTNDPSLIAIKARMLDMEKQFSDLVAQYKLVGLGRDDGLNGMLHAAVRRAEEKLESFVKKYRIEDTASPVRLHILHMRQLEKDYMLYGDPAVIASFGESYKKLLKSMKPSGFKIVGRMEMKGFLKVYRKDFHAWIQGSRDLKAKAKTYRSTVKATAQIISAEAKKAALEADRQMLMAVETQRTASFTFYSLAVGLMVVAALASLAIAASITRPLSHLAHAMERICRKEMSVALPRIESRDELGQLANAAQKFLDSVQVSSRLQSDARLDAQRELTRQDDLDALLKTFRVQTEDAIKRVQAEAQKVGGSAQSLNSIASQAEITAQSASKSTLETRRSMGDVNENANHLTEAAQDISQETSKATQVAAQANETAEEANRSMQQLNQSADQIGDIVEMIGKIAAQTNLLALNATIEAARAGEMGKGFAVVAEEVKQLSTQTAQATETIAAQIADIQSSAGDATKSLDRITQMIGSVNEVTLAITHSVDQQTEATHGMAGHIQSAMAGSESASHTVEQVAQTIAQSRSEAESFKTVSLQLDDVVGDLSISVRAFLNAVENDLKARKEEVRGGSAAA